MVASPKWRLTQNAFMVVCATVEKYKSTISLFVTFWSQPSPTPSLAVIGDTWEGSALLMCDR